MRLKRKKLDSRCLKVWAEIVKYKQVCAVSGKTQSSLNPVIFHAHHVIPRGYSAGRYRTDNGLCLCESVHIREKAEPEKFHKLILNTIGEDAYDRLRLRYRQTYKIPTIELQDVLMELKNELKELKNV